MRRDGDTLVLPGIATAHSHAFQRALRGRTQRARGTFWSWRAQMYALVERLTPESLYAISHFAFVELAMAGVTAVGEFHYVQHQPDGTPYADRTLLADTVIRAARDAGLRITLLRAAYHRAGYGRAAEPGQRRFCDPDVDTVLRDVETLVARHAGDRLVQVGIAPHSLRAVPREWLAPIGEFARSGGRKDTVEGKPNPMIVSAHLSEQRREVQECIAEHHFRPTHVWGEEGLLDERFVAVHATHLDASEIAALGRSLVCICRTTERDLGDGHPAAGELVAAGARLCTGIDSYSITDPFEEARAIELDARPVAEARHVVADGDALLAALTSNGYAALGLDGKESEDRVVLDLNDAAMVGCGDDASSDAVVFSASPRAVKEVSVAGRELVQEGVHVAYDAARAGFEKLR